VIARNDGTKLSSLRNDSPASGGNERGWNDGSGDARDKEERTASANGSPRGQIGVIDPIRMESDAEIRGFLINRQPAFFVGSRTISYHHVSGSLNVSASIRDRPVP